MQKYLFLSDTHIDCFSIDKFNKYINNIKKIDIDGIWIAGDIANGSIGLQYIQYLQSCLAKKIFFICGNHDFYNQEIEKYRKICSNLDNKNVKYLTSLDLIELNTESCLIGEDGWYDGGWGDNHYLLLSSLDFFKIKDFKLFDSAENKLEMIKKLANDAVNRLKPKLEKAYINYNIVYLITHVPPWAETDRKDFFDKLWIPYNSSKIMTIFLEDFMKSYPTKKLKILAGHTHRSRNFIKNNIEMYVSDAKIGSMNINNIIKV